MLNGMKQDFSWDKAAKEYVRLYRRALKKLMAKLFSNSRGKRVFTVAKPP